LVVYLGDPRILAVAVVVVLVVIAVGVFLARGRRY
jgi:hypothetical protein